MKVYVRNQDGAPLMPCKEAKARKLLRAGKARVVAQVPFTIQLAWQCEGQVQDVTVGIDKGSSVTGISCVSNGEVLLAAEIHHRRDVSEKRHIPAYGHSTPEKPLVLASSAILLSHDQKLRSATVWSTIAH